MLTLKFKQRIGHEVVDLLLQITFYILNAYGRVEAPVVSQNCESNFLFCAPVRLSVTN